MVRQIDTKEIQVLKVEEIDFTAKWLDKIAHACCLAGPCAIFAISSLHFLRTCRADSDQDRRSSQLLEIGAGLGGTGAVQIKFCAYL